MSVPPPGAAGTTTLTGLLGYCADAAATNDASIAPARAVRRIIANPPDRGASSLTHQPAAAVDFFPHSGDHSVIRNVRAGLPRCQYARSMRQIDVRCRACEPRVAQGATPMSRVEDREFIQSLAKGLAVIESFGPQMPAMTLSEVARKTKLSPGSA